MTEKVDPYMQELIDAQKSRQTGEAYKPNPALKMLTPKTDETYMQTLIDEQKARQAGSPNGKPMAESTPITVEGAIEKHVEHKFGDYLQFVGDELGIGAQSVYEGDMGAEAADGSLSYEEVEQKILEGRKRAEASGERSKSFIAHQEGVFKFIEHTTPALEAVPLLMSAGMHYFAGARGGTVVGAILGGGVPAAEAVTIPTMATWGGGQMMFNDLYRKAKGHRYLELRRKGLSHEQARISAIANATLQATAGSFGLKQLGGAAGQAFKQSQARAGLITHINAMLWNAGKTVGFQTAMMLGSEEINILADVLDGLAYQNAAVFPKSLDEINKRLMTSIENGFKQAALISAGIHVAAKTTGIAGAAGEAVKGALAKKQVKPPTTTLEHLKMLRWMQENPYLPPEYMPDFKADESGVLKATVEKSELSLEDAVVMAEGKKLQIKDKLDELKAERESVQKSGVEFPGDKTLEELNVEIEETTKSYAKAAAGEKKAKLKVQRFKAEERATDPNVSNEAKAKAEAEIKNLNNKLHQIKKTEIKTNAQAKLDSVNASLKGAEQAVYDLTQKQVDILNEKARDLKIKLKVSKTAKKPTAKIEKDIQRTETEITNLKQQMAGGEPSPSLKLKLDRKKNLLTEKNDLETLLAVIDESKPEDLRGMKADLPQGPVSTLFNLAAHAIRRAGIQKGKSIKKNQELLTGIIKKQLPKRLRGEFLEDIKKVQTEEQLGKAIESVQKRIEAIIEKEAHEQAMLDLHEQLDRPRIKTSGTRKVNQLTSGDAHESLKMIDELVKKPTLAEENIDAYLANRDDGVPLKEKEEMEYEASKLVGNVREKSAEQVNELTAAIKDILDYETNTNIKRAKERQEVYEALVEHTARGLQGKNPVDMDPQGSKKNYAKHNKFQQSDNPFFRFLASINLRTGEASASTFIQKLHIALQDLPPAERQFIIDQLDVMAKADDLRAEKESLYIDLMLDYAKEATGLSEKDTIQLYGKMARATIRIDFTDTDLNPRVWEGTRAELADIQAGFKDKTLHDGYEFGNKFSGKDIGETLNKGDWKDRTVKDDFQSVVENPATGLSQVEINLNTARKKWYQELHADMAEGYRKETKGLVLPKNKEYSGPAKHFRLKEDAKAAKEELLPRFSGLAGDFAPIKTKNKSTQSRENSKLKIQGQNIFLKDLEYAHNLARYTEMQHASEVLSVFADKRIIHIMDAKFPGLRNEITSHIKDAVNGQPRIRGGWQKFMNWFIAQHPKIALAAKPLMLPKQQLAGLATFSIGVPVQKFFNYVDEYYTNPEAGNNIIWQSKSVQRRYERFGETHGGVTPEISGIQKEGIVRKTLMAPIIEGDKGALPGFYAQYMYHLKDLGKTHEQAMQAAERSFDIQGSKNVSAQSNIARDPNWKWITLYQNQPTAMALEGVKTFRDAVNHPSLETWQSAAEVAIKTRIAEALFVSIDSAWKYATAKDDQERDRAIRAPFKALVTGATPYIIGWMQQAVTTIGFNVLGGITKGKTFIGNTWEKWYEPSFAFWDAGKNTGLLLEDIVKPLGPKETQTGRMFKALLHYNSSFINMFFGQVPLGPPVKLMKQIDKSNESSSRKGVEFNQ